MDVAGVVFRQSVCFSSNSCRSESFPVMKKPGSVCLKQQSIRKSVVVGLVSSDMFSDKSHLEYYYNGPRMEVKEKEDIGSKKKEMKKKLKLLKGLSKNLNTFSDMGFGLNPENGLDHQVKGQIISDATEVLLGQLQKLKAEKMESKRIKKEEKAKKKAARMMTECKDSSSSSSSSESDCDNVVNMKQIKAVATSNLQQEVIPLQIQEVGNPVIENSICKDVVSNLDVNCKKIEVCMGGKCKKSGAAMLLENFQVAAGGEVAVVGCKCMGKCKDGPNVRVGSDGDAVSNSLCIGVGLEDIDSIVTNVFGKSRGSCSDMVPALSGI